MKLTHPNPVALAKRAFFLAYQASEVVGMGRYQARVAVTEEDVWRNVSGSSSDYVSGGTGRANKPYGDYVYGRMMKLSLEILPEGVDAMNEKPRRDYQSWAQHYPTYEDLLVAAAENLATETKEATG